KIVLFVLFYTLLFTNAGFSDFSKVGTAVAPFLKIGVGARAMGMGETFVAVANDASTLYWNPAGMTNLEKTSLIASHSMWFADIYHDYVGIVIPKGSNYIGVSAIALNTGEEEITTIEEPDGTGLYYDVNMIALGLSYARKMTDRFSTGITVKYVSERLHNVTAQTMAFDIGTYLRTGYHGLVIAMNISNLGGKMQLEGRDLIAIANTGGNNEIDARFKTQPYPLPLNFRVGVAMDVIGGFDPFMQSEKSRFTIAIDGNHPNDNTERINTGIEYAYDEMLFVRAGYKINYDVEKWAFGGGLKFNVGQKIMSVDYAMVDYGDLGMVSRFSLELRF
ncbi:MAG: PorV/PorQ family protein, partial [Calditrichia bacterium]|nr:PorV/PorQ family protein [Calditrichia bacterium]